MAGMSDYLEDAVLKEIFRNTNLTPPTTYLALFTADPTDAGTLTSEVTGGAYARVLVNRDGATAPFWAAPVTNGAGGFKVENQSVIDFPTATASWGTITHMAVIDSASGAGNMLWSGALTASKIIDNTDKMSFPANSIVINLD